MAQPLCLLFCSVIGYGEGNDMVRTEGIGNLGDAGGILFCRLEGAAVGQCVNFFGVAVLREVRGRSRGPQRDTQLF